MPEPDDHRNMSEVARISLSFGWQTQCTAATPNKLVAGLAGLSHTILRSVTPRHCRYKCKVDRTWYIEQIWHIGVDADFELTTRA